MDYTIRLALSYYKTIATLNEPHKIYLVQHQETNKIYVKKVLDIYNKEIFIRLYNNPITGIPKIIDLFEIDNQLIVIENYISGSSLQEIIDSGKLTKETIYEYMDELCSILEKLHNFSPPIIHRDIKPSNIIITEHNHLMLLDFNAAKYMTNKNENDTVLLGTKGYAAPEQYGFGSSTEKTDIYALGILLKEMVSSISSNTYEFNNIILKCSQINPEDRYYSVTQLKYALKKVRYPNPQRKPITLKDLILPGYRTLKPWKMIIATLGYLCIISLTPSLNIDSANKAVLYIDRFFFFLMMISIVFCCFNYMDIRSYFPLSKHKNRFLRYLGVFILNVLIIFSLLLAMTFVSDMFS